MLDIVQVARTQLENGALSESDCPLLLVNGLNRQARFDPAIEHDYFCVGGVPPVLQIAFAKAEARLSFRPVRILIQRFCDAEIAVIWMPCSHGASPINPQFAKEPFALADFRHVRGP